MAAFIFLPAFAAFRLRRSSRSLFVFCFWRDPPRPFPVTISKSQPVTAS